RPVAELDFAPSAGRPLVRFPAAGRGEAAGLAIRSWVCRRDSLFPRRLRRPLPAARLGRFAVRLQPLPVDGLLQLLPQPDPILGRPGLLCAAWRGAAPGAGAHANGAV